MPFNLLAGRGALARLYLAGLHHLKQNHEIRHAQTFQQYQACYLWIIQRDLTMLFSDAAVAAGREFGVMP